MEIILFLCSLLIIILLFKELKLRKGLIDLDNVTISNSNKIRFVKLQKEYLDKVSLPEILELNSFIQKYYIKRLQNENKK